MMQYDQYSMKAYMTGNRTDTQPWLDKAGLMPYPTNVVNWCETFDTSSGSYDKALTEAVMDTLAFSWDGKPFAWKHIMYVFSVALFRAPTNRQSAEEPLSSPSPSISTCPRSQDTRALFSTLALWA